MIEFIKKNALYDSPRANDRVMMTLLFTSGLQIGARTIDINVAAVCVVNEPGALVL